MPSRILYSFSLSEVSVLLTKRTCLVSINHKTIAGYYSGRKDANINLFVTDDNF